jgi:lipopolysaccharide biosynthesis glycosyltransferase
MERYAARCGADFIVLDQPRVNFTAATNFRSVLFEKYQLHDILSHYDRVLYMDTDMLVTPHAPDVFEVVPETHVGCVFEDVGTARDHRREQIRLVQEALGDLGWTHDFMNSGVMVLSRRHRDAFRLWESAGFYDGCYEQNNTNWYFRKLGFQFMALDYKWNFMKVFRDLHEIWGTAHREAYFLHYAGGGLISWAPREAQMLADYRYFYSPDEYRSEDDPYLKFTRPLLLSEPDYGDDDE